MVPWVWRLSQCSGYTLIFQCCLLKIIPHNTFSIFSSIRDFITKFDLGGIFSTFITFSYWSWRKRISSFIFFFFFYFFQGKCLFYLLQKMLKLWRTDRSYVLWQEASIWERMRTLQFWFRNQESISLCSGLI